MSAADPRRPPGRDERRDRSSWSTQRVEAERRAAATLLSPSPGDPPWPPPPTGWHHATIDPVWAFPVPFTVADGLWLVLWAVLAQVLVAVPLAALVGPTTSAVERVTAVLCIQAVTLVGAWGLLRARGAWSWRVAGPVRPRPRHVGLGVLVGALTWIGLIALLGVYSTLTGYEPETQQVLVRDARDGGAAVVVLGAIVAVVGAPLLEELLHRGVVFQALRRRAGLVPAVLLSAGIFAGLHLELLSEPPQLAALFGVGVMLALVLHRVGTLVAAIAAHATFNAISFTLATLAAAATTAT